MHPRNSQAASSNNSNSPKLTRTSSPDQIFHGDSSPFMSAYGQQIRSTLYPVGDDRAKQSFKEESDINRIMSRYQVTGQLPDNLLNQGTPRFIDATGLDYQQAMETVAHAQSLFEQLPSSVRDRFGNDPQRFLEFAEEPENTQELVQMGLGARPAASEPLPPKEPAPSAPTPPSAPANGIVSQPLPGIPPASGAS